MTTLTATRARRLVGERLGLVLLPLSLLPLLVLVPALLRSHASFARLYADRDPLPAPVVRFGPAERAAFRPLPTFRGAVPVLAYHGIGERGDGLMISRRAFAEQMAMLRLAGYHAISAEQYARFPGGSAKDLPSRPILITFDDGRLDSFRGADAILRRYGLRATMFVITERADDRNASYLTWDELRAMRASGRWDVQLHANDGHRSVTVDARGTQGAAYTNRSFADGRLESFDHYRERVRDDLAEGMRRLQHELPGTAPLLFAVPFSADGDPQANDPRIYDFLDRTFHAGFRQVFVAGRPVAPPREAQHTLRRYEVRADTMPRSLYRWLAIDPRTPQERRAQAARHVLVLRAAGRDVPAALLAQAGMSPSHRYARRHALGRRTAPSRRIVRR